MLADLNCLDKKPLENIRNSNTVMLYHDQRVDNTYTDTRTRLEIMTDRSRLLLEMNDYALHLIGMGNPYRIALCEIGQLGKSMITPWQSIAMITYNNQNRTNINRTSS